MFPIKVLQQCIKDSASFWSFFSWPASLLKENWAILMTWEILTMESIFHVMWPLFWFAQSINSVEENNVFQVNFEPSRVDFWFHWFQNYKHILPPINQLYYAILLFCRSHVEPPSCQLLWHGIFTVHTENNIDSLVVAVMQNNQTGISRVFLTSDIYTQNSFEPYDTRTILN